MGAVSESAAAREFRVTYAPELAQYVAERGDMRVVPSVIAFGPHADPDAAQRAREVCEVLNRVYAAGATK